MYYHNIINDLDKDSHGHKAFVVGISTLSASTSFKAYKVFVNLNTKIVESSF